MSDATDDLEFDKYKARPEDFNKQLSNENN